MAMVVKILTAPTSQIVLSLMLLGCFWVGCGSQAPDYLDSEGNDADVDGDSDGDADSDADSDSDSDGDLTKDTGTACGSADVDFSEVIPTVVLLVDRSLSMDAGFSGTTRWEAVYDVLMNPGPASPGVVTQLGSKVRFGLELYTSHGGFGSDPLNPKTCPELISVSPALDNFAAIDAEYDSDPNNIGIDTPTGDSVDAVVNGYLMDEPDPKIIILATDGMPDSCENNDSSPEAEQEAVDAVRNAYDSHDINTYVIFVGPTNTDVTTHMTQVANVGVGIDETVTDPDFTAPWYAATSTTDLTDALSTIIAGVRTCSIKLAGEVQEGKENDCSVSVGGSSVTFDDPDGWRLDATTRSEVEFLGSSCTQILDPDASADIKVNCPCDTIIPVF